jgi:hypothetical protein
MFHYKLHFRLQRIFEHLEYFGEQINSPIEYYKQNLQILFA